MNMEAFKKAPVLYSKINEVFDRCEKVDDYTVRFFLTEKYGCFMNDLIWMQFYTKDYLDIAGWNGKATCPNLSTPGPYGLGPYILEEGYIEGDRQTPVAVLKANPNYWDKRYPKVEKITVYTELDSSLAKNLVLEQEGELDIAFIPPEYKVDTILSPYAKLIVSPTTNNIAIHMNLINGNPKLLDLQVRRAPQCSTESTQSVALRVRPRSGGVAHTGIAVLPWHDRGDDQARSLLGNRRPL